MVERSDRRRRRYILLPAEPSTRRAPAQASDAVPDLDRVARSVFSKSRRELIAETAYYRSQRRGFQGGTADQDWYEAEAEIEALLERHRPR